jgi:hypothetical protein
LTITTYHFRFGDCTERWSSFFELRRLGDPEEEEEGDEGTTGLPAPSPPKTRLELLQAGLAIKNPPKKTHLKKTH